MKRTIFWGLTYVMLLVCTILLVAWVLASVAGDPLYEADCFRRLVVAFGWTVLLIGVGTGCRLTAKKA